MREDQTPPEKPKSFTEVAELFKFKWGRDYIGESRSTLLVVVALIVTVTFQAGINPPPLLFDKSNNSSSGAIVTFSVVNTIAFSASATMLEYLTSGFPFQRLLTLALIFMSASYGVAIANTGLIGTKQLYAVLFSIFVPQLVRWGSTLMRKIFCC